MACSISIQVWRVVTDLMGSLARGPGIWRGILVISSEAKAIKASLARDATLMRELQVTEMWDCICHQLTKMEAQATDRLLDQTETMDQVNYWRGRLASVREFRQMPEMIIRWSKQYGESQ